MALKYADRIVGATAGNHHNNCFMDIMMTPYAAQLIPNTLNCLLGSSTFKADIRFAPYIRTYIFEDAQKRPVAAVWCHREEVDDGTADAPVVEADFKKSLEGVFDLMNSPRAFTVGKFRFPVSGFPVFLRGRPGTLEQFETAFGNASVISGEGVSPIEVLVKPDSPDSIQVTLTNRLGMPFSGTLNGRKVLIPASGNRQITLPSGKKITADKLNTLKLPLKLKGTNGSSFAFDRKITVLAVREIPENTTLDTIDWNKLPKLAIPKRWGKPATSGTFQAAWSRRGLFLRVQINDRKFVHVEYKIPADRWKNDCLQIYFDTLGDAGSKRRGYDENDCSYAIFPNAKGDQADFFVSRPVEQQLGLGGQSPRSQSFLPDVPCKFSCRDGMLTYELFIKAAYLLPIQCREGYCFGFSLFAPDSSKANSINGALTLTEDGGPSAGRPHVWPFLLLTR